MLNSSAVAKPKSEMRAVKFLVMKTLSDLTSRCMKPW